MYKTHPHAVVQSPLVLLHHSLKAIGFFVATVCITLPIVTTEKVDRRCFWDTRLELKDAHPLCVRGYNGAEGCSPRNSVNGHDSLL